MLHSHDLVLDIHLHTHCHKLQCVKTFFYGHAIVFTYKIILRYVICDMGDLMCIHHLFGLSRYLFARVITGYHYTQT